MLISGLRALPAPAYSVRVKNTILLHDGCKANPHGARKGKEVVFLTAAGAFLVTINNPNRDVS